MEKELFLISSSQRWRFKEAANYPLLEERILPHSFEVQISVEEWDGVGFEVGDQRGVPRSGLDLK